METDRQMIRAAAETLHASIQSQRSSYSHSITSVNRATDIILSEDLIAGARQNGRMSNVRRFFCLLVTFDLFFTCLLWLICSTLAGENAESAFIDQVVHYEISKSLFDIVMAAVCRFTVLILFYALLYMNHWFIVALSTSFSCAFLIAKVFLFDWSTYTQPVFQVLLILTSFVLAWGEAWFFDIRVVPQETQARDWILGSLDSERAPLLHPIVPSSNQYHENVGTFYTPVESPDRSDNEDEEDSRRRLDSFSPKSVILTVELTEELRKKALSLLDRSYDLLTSEEWIEDKRTPEGDVISYLQYPKTGKKILRISGIINVPAKVLSDHLFENVETSCKWNKQLTESKRINILDENTDIVYQVTPSFGNGIVTARDFVILRHRGIHGPYFISCGMSITFPEYPSRKNITRGNTDSCFVFEDLPDVRGKSCRFTWILNTELKLWLPQKVIHNLSVTALADFMAILRNHAQTLRS